MTASDSRARRYLLGMTTDEERDAIEQEYFASPQQLDRVGDAEDELIEDYLEHRLSDEEREQFEREYLASPVHRARVETIRRLGRHATVSSGHVRRPSRPLQPRWVAAAAAVLLVLAGLWAGAWIAGRRDAPERQATTSTPTPLKPTPRTSPGRAEPPSSAALPRVFAVELPAVALRSAGDGLRVVIPAGTDLVDVRFEIQPGTAASRRSTVAIATISGEEVWRGPAMRDRDTTHAQVPASVLPPDDYIVTLHGGAGSGDNRYFLRVRRQ